MSSHKNYKELLETYKDTPIEEAKELIEQRRKRIGQHAHNAKLKNWDRFVDVPDSFIHIVLAGHMLLDIDRVEKVFEHNHYNQEVWDMHVAANATYLPEFKLMRKVYKEALKDPWSKLLETYKNATKKRTAPETGGEDPEGSDPIPSSEGLDS